MAGTQVRDASSTDPTLIGRNNCEDLISSAFGHGAASGVYLMRSGGRQAAISFVVRYHRASAQI
jgi:hypothetical protein